MSLIKENLQKNKEIQTDETIIVPTKSSESQTISTKNTSKTSQTITIQTNDAETSTIFFSTLKFKMGTLAHLQSCKIRAHTWPGPS